MIGVNAWGLMSCLEKGERLDRGKFLDIDECAEWGIASG